MTPDIKKITKKLEKKLDSKRFDHTIGVEFTSTSLAMAHGASVKKAQLAGLLHDCAKCIPDSEKLALCEEYKLSISNAERENPGLLHAKLGSFKAKQDYGIDDPEILSAIEWHTTGKPGMNLLEKIVFVADYIEPSRKQAPNLDEIRRLAFINIDLAILMILEDTLLYLGQTGKAIDPITKRTYDYYFELVGKH